MQSAFRTVSLSGIHAAEEHMIRQAASSLVDLVKCGTSIPDGSDLVADDAHATSFTGKDKTAYGRDMPPALQFHQSLIALYLERADTPAAIGIHRATGELLAEAFDSNLFPMLVEDQAATTTFMKDVTSVVGWQTFRGIGRSVSCPIISDAAADYLAQNCRLRTGHLQAGWLDGERDMQVRTIVNAQQGIATFLKRPDRGRLIEQAQRRTFKHMLYDAA